MKTSFPLVLACATLMVSPAFARDYGVTLAPPPPPEKVLRDIKGFFQKVGSGVRDVSKQTWSSIRERFTEDPRSARPTRPRQVPPPAPPPFSQSRDAVPYPYDDADTFDTTVPGPNDTLPKVNIVPRDPSKLEPGDQAKPLTTEPRKSFMTPDPDFAATTSTRPAPLPDLSSAAPKASVPPASEIEFARRVPGKRGLVYPPGSKETSENMVDVGDFQTGQIVRDPRTGKLFRVP